MALIRPLPFFPLAIPLLLIPMACSASGEGVPLPLIEASQWEEVSSANDPFWALDSASDTTVCGAQNWVAEGEATEVTTSDCNYITLVQASPVNIAAGDSLQLSVWWQTLASEGAALGHFAVFIGETALLDEAIPIPAEADARDIGVVSSQTHPAGTPIYFHIHNHGFNSWTLGSLTVQHQGRK